MSTEKDDKFISCVIYLYNNEKNIIPFMSKLYNEMKKHFKFFEMICVNDICEDNTITLLHEFASHIKDCSICITNMSFHQGVELAMNAGMDTAIGDFVFEFDYVQENFPLEEIFQAYNTTLKGYDIVSVSPQKNTDFLSNLFYKIFNMYSHRHYMLKTEIFRVVSRRAINRCKSLGKFIPYRKAVYADSGLKMETIYCAMKNAPLTSSNKAERVNLALNSLILFTSVANNFTLKLTSLFIFLCFLCLCYIVYIYFSITPISGWTTIMLFLSFGFSSILIILGIILKYLSVIIDIVFKDKKYIVESIEKITK